MRFLFWEIKRLPAVVKKVASEPAAVLYKRNGEQIHRLLYPGDILELDFDPIKLTQTEQKMVDSLLCNEIKLRQHDAALQRMIETRERMKADLLKNANSSWVAL